jgi:hypothetical protein
MGRLVSTRASTQWLVLRTALYCLVLCGHEVTGARPLGPVSAAGARLALNAHTPRDLRAKVCPPCQSVCSCAAGSKTPLTTTANKSRMPGPAPAVFTGACVRTRGTASSCRPLPLRQPFLCRVYEAVAQPALESRGKGMRRRSSLRVLRRRTRQRQARRGGARQHVLPLRSQ